MPARSRPPTSRLRAPTHTSSTAAATSRGRCGSSPAARCGPWTSSSTSSSATTAASTATRSSRGSGRRVSARAPSRTDLLLAAADDELILGWRDSEWTGIAPSLEEDVAFSSIAQNEIGHARALYELAARDLGTTADELAFDRKPGEYRCAPLVQIRRVDWAHTIARHWLYETADELRLAVLKESDDLEVAGLAAKMDREEVYHRLHAQMWADHLRDEPRFRTAVEELWPYAIGLLDDDLR